MVIIICCPVRFPLAAEWHCGNDIAGRAPTQTSSPDKAGDVWHGVSLTIDAVDAFTAPNLPGRIFRLADVAIVPEYEDAVLAWLEAHKSHQVTITALAGNPDFLGRIPARIVGNEVAGNSGATDWRAELLEAGLVMFYPETGHDVDELIAFENVAINKRSGLWAGRTPKTSYLAQAAPGSSSDGSMPAAKDMVGRFAVIDGVVKSIEHQEWRSYLNFGKDWRSDFTIALGAEVREALSQNGDYQNDMQNWIGRSVRVRGVIENRGGPYVALSDPSQLCLGQEQDRR